MRCRVPVRPYVLLGWIAVCVSTPLAPASAQSSPATGPSSSISNETKAGAREVYLALRIPPGARHEKTAELIDELRKTTALVVRGGVGDLRASQISDLDASAERANAILDDLTVAAAGDDGELTKLEAVRARLSTLVSAIHEADKLSGAARTAALEQAMERFQVAPVASHRLSPMAVGRRSPTLHPSPPPDVQN